MDIDWAPLLCKLEALRLEIRAYSFSVSAATTGMHPEKADEFLQRMEFEQHNADRVAQGLEREN